MTSFVTLWISSSTKQAESQVARIIRATGDFALSYDSLSVVGNKSGEIAEKISGAFHSLVSMTMPDPTLHIFAIVPLFEEGFSNHIRILNEACLAVQRNITLHILGLSNNIRGIFQSTDKSVDLKDAEDKNIKLLKTICREATISISYSIIDDYAANGAPIRFTLKSLSNYLALIQIAIAQDYNAILPPTLLNTHLGDNLSVGLATLSFNKETITNQLLGLGFLTALRDVGIDNTKVNAQKAANEADKLLSGISEHYTDFYDKSIHPLYTEQGLDEKEAVVKSSEFLSEDLDNLKSRILDLLKDNNFSLPEKEAILAMVIGRDNEGLSGMQYQHEGLILDDVCNIPMNLYIQAFNAYCVGTSPQLLPVRGDFEVLKKYEWDDETGEKKESPENKKAFNPLSDIKELKQEILDNTAFIRDRTKELDNHQKSINLHKKTEEIKLRWHKPTGDLKDIEYKEQPLDDKYIPSSDVEIKGSVDLRKFFNPVRNQKNLGSCTAFAVVSMYETLMKRNGVTGDTIMSPAYLYYYSNILTGRPGGGSNFYEQLEVLGKHGVCFDSLYPYDTEDISASPSNEAEKDAPSHRVISAKQIPLVNSVNKHETLKRNHKLITSALSEGYPVGISLKTFENFGKDGAFILHPNDIPNAKEEGWHAMVIVGYEREDFYVVRNSWGAEFGEEGYCYIPSAYIDDPDYLSFACVITEISDAAILKADIPTILADFAATETDIKIAAIRNVITKAKVELESNQLLYTEYYKYYQQLVTNLTIPNTQKIIRQAVETNKKQDLTNIEDRKKELEESFIETLNKYKASLKKKIVMFFIVACLALSIAFCLYSVTWLLFAILSVGLGSISLVSYKWNVRIKHKQLNQEIINVAEKVKRQKEIFKETPIRYHIAGMWLKNFHILSIELGNVYNCLVSFNDSLRAWKEYYSSQIGQAEIPEGHMFISTDSTPLLETFFMQIKTLLYDILDC